MINMADYTNVLKKVFKLQEKMKIKGMSIAIVSSSKVLLSAQNGFADFYGERKVEADTKFMIGSITKTITAIAIMQLVESGLIDLDADIKTYIPNFKIKNRFDDYKITIKDILYHRSGLPGDDYGMILSNPAIDYNELIIYLQDQYLIAPPGKMFAYSNIGYTLLGIVIEKVTKKKYTEYVQKNIFNPMGINGDFIITPDDFRQHRYEVSRSYNTRGEEKIDNLSSMIPAGSNTYVSAVDLAKIIQMFLNKGKVGNKRILREQTIIDMQTKPEFADEIDYCYGLGLAFDYYKLNNIGTIIGHSGDTIYHHAAMWYIPDSDIGIVVLTNTNNGNRIMDDTIIPLLEETLTDFGYKKEIETKKKIKNIYRTFRIEDYTGNYPTTSGLIKVTYNKQLRMQLGPLTAKMFLKDDGWFDLKATGGLSIIGSKIFSRMNVKIEKELLTIKVNRGNNQYFSTVMGVFVRPFEINGTWLEACGNYQCFGKKKDNIYAKAKMYVKDNFLTIKFKGGLNKNKMNILGTVDDNEAIILGYGRESSETIFISDKILIYMGTIFIKESGFKAFLRRIGVIKTKIKQEEENE